MASPQTENGYTRIANEIVEALSRCAPGHGQMQVLWVILRKTYGWHKKTDELSISQIEDATSLSRRMVIYCLQNLEAKRMITVTRNRGQDGKNEINCIGFQKNHSLWVVQENSTQYKKALENRKLSYQRSRPGVVQEIKGSARNTTKVVQEIGKNVSFLAPTKERKKTKERVKGKPSHSNGSDPRFKKFVDWWHLEYQKRFSNRYHHNGGKEGNLIKSLLRDYDLPKLQDLARRFFDSNDSWVQQTGGYTIGVFASQINRLISTAKTIENRPQRKELPA